ARDAEQTADRGQHAPFDEKQTPDAGRGEADGAKQADLARALLDAETEEQSGEHQRREDEEEAEVGEVLAEVRGSARGGDAIAANVAHRQSEGERIDCGAEMRKIAIARAGWRSLACRRDAHRGAVAEARPPQPTADLERDERLRRGAVPFPIVLVDAPDPVQVDRKLRVPVAESPRPGDGAEDRRQIA